MKIILIDTAYPEFLASLPFDDSGTYESELEKVMSRQFGTANFFSKNLTPLGWECMDVIANHSRLQQMWRQNHRWFPCNEDRQIALEQIQDFTPDVVFLQDLSYFDQATLSDLSKRYILAGQISCALPSRDLSVFHCLFSSFPFYVDRFNGQGIKAVYLPLAFEPSVVDACHVAESESIDGGRIHDCVFIGGVGNPSHWKQGMETLEAVAREIPTFKWWGYGIEKLPFGEDLPFGSPLRSAYQGEAWGRKMYEILLQSKICLNRTGEVAEGFANNLRMYEATGCGALLVTEAAPNLGELFGEYSVVTYDSPQDAVYKIRHYLDSPALLNHVSNNGRAETLRRHTYADRMKTVSETLETMLRAQFANDYREVVRIANIPESEE